MLTVWFYLLACTGIEKESVRLSDSAPPDSGAQDQDGDGVPDAQDCAPADPAVFPGAPEYCNAADDDCDGVIDNDVKDAESQWPDLDGDTFGDSLGVTAAACEPVAGYVLNNLDCDDADAAINPGSPELCDERDNDCDQQVDEGIAEMPEWFIDADGDGYGADLEVLLACVGPAGYVDRGFDCDDSRADVNPDGEEVCDGIDNDCDTFTDINASDAVRYCYDNDGDGYGDPVQCAGFCGVQAGWATNSDDCSDIEAAVFPGAVEVCNYLDDNCDGAVDDDAVDRLVWYPDGDGDGYGYPNAQLLACNQPPNHVAINSDCNDTVATTYPGAPELCNGQDDDCDGQLWSGEAIDSDHDGIYDCADP